MMVIRFYQELNLNFSATPTVLPLHHKNHLAYFFRQVIAIPATVIWIPQRFQPLAITHVFQPHMFANQTWSHRQGSNLHGVVLNININMNKCLRCNTDFKPGPGSTGKFCSLVCSKHHNGMLRRQTSIQKYFLNPKRCKNCDTIIAYRKSNQFCNRSCAGIYNNAKKDWDNITTGPKPKPKPPKRGRKPRSILIDADGPHTRIYLSTCKITGKKWYSTSIKTIHPSAILTKKLYAYQCRFTFSISEYPKLFGYASELIEKHGWYSAANKGNNLSGCSRDHLYSVNDGFINKVDPKIISHPMNCKIVPHRENQSKNKKSTITLDELIERIKLFDKMESVTGIQPVLEVLQTST